MTDDASARALDAIVRVGLEEDLNDSGDVTSLATIPDQVLCQGVLRAKSPGVLAGCAAFTAVFHQVGWTLYAKAK